LGKKRYIGMTVLLVIVYLIAGFIALAVLYWLVLAILGAVRARKKKWIERSPVDRRKRQLPVKADRRRRARRQADVAAQFLNDLDE